MEEALQMTEEIISEDKPEDSSQITETKEPKSALNTPDSEDINLGEVELEMINTEDLVHLFPEEDC